MTDHAVTARERVARSWHDGSDHAADGVPFGGPLCNCDQVAERMLPMLRDAWDEGHLWGWSDAQESHDVRQHMARADWPLCTPSPYKTEEDRHVDQ